MLCGLFKRRFRKSGNRWYRIHDNCFGLSLSICQKKHEILIFAQHDTQLPQHCSIVKVEDVIEALYACKQKNVECLIVQNSQETNKLFNEDLGGLKLVMWAHSFMSRMQWNLYARSANVKRIVCVGNEELELYCDHKAFKKSTVILMLSLYHPVHRLQFLFKKERMKSHSWQA